MVILRAKQVKKADCVILCTTTRKMDDPLIAIAEKNDIQHFRGSVEDKLDRWHGAAEAFGIDLIATFDGDDLLCEPELIDNSLDFIVHNNLDFVKAPEGLAVGAFTYALRSSALKKVCEIKNSEDTEMMWTYFEDTGFFACSELPVESVFILPDARLTLDYIEDYNFFSTIFEKFDNIDNATSLRTILPFLSRHPEILQINAARSKEWRANQIQKTRLILKECCHDDYDARKKVDGCSS
jgi:spore coat polysaccharide biosynthesis protein SpsF